MGLRRLGRWRREPKGNRAPVQPFDFLGILADFKELIFIHAGKYLPDTARGPKDFNAFNPGGFSQANMLFEGRGAERSPASYSPVNRTQALTLVFHS